MIESTTWLFIVLLFLIIISAFFSGSETSMIASNKYRLRNLAKENRKAKLALKLLEDTDSLIGTILLGNNFVNILAASIATVLAIELFGESFVGLASIILTIIILIFAENTPKTFAAKNPEKVAIFSAPIINIFIKIFYPIVWIVKKITIFILSILNIDKFNENSSVSIEELKMSVLDAKSSIADNYHQILLNIIDLKEVSVEDIMIPKTELISADIDNLDDIIRTIKQTNHTRILVYKIDKENIIGILHMRDIVNLYASDNFNFNNLKKLIRKVYFIPEGISLATQLEQFQKRKKRLALVVNEYGGVKGMVVLEDILEEIVGQFTSNANEKIEEISLQKDGSYLIDSSINLHKLSGILGIKFNTNSKTLNGLILDKLQAVPQRDVSIRIGNIVIEILRIKDNNIKLVSLKFIK